MKKYDLSNYLKYNLDNIKVIYNFLDLSLVDKLKVEKITETTRSIHFLLKPAEDGIAELEKFPPPFRLSVGKVNKELS